MTSRVGVVPIDDDLEAIRRRLMRRRFGTWEWERSSGQLTVCLVAQDALPQGKDGDRLRSHPVHPGDAAWFGARACEALDSGQQFIALPVRLVDGDKQVGWFLASGGTQADVPYSLAGFIIEVAYARPSVESLYASVLDSLTEKVAITDRRGVIVETNRAWAASDADSLVPGRRVSTGTNIIDAFDTAAPNRPSIAKAATSMLAVLSGRAKTFETEYSVGGEERWYALRVFRLQAPEGGLVVVLHDITDRRHAERERSLHRAELGRTARAAVLGQLSGAIAHELNQPLTAILANAQAGLDAGGHGLPLDQLLEILKDIEHDTKRAGEVIKRVRRLLRMDQSDFSPLDLNRVVEDVLLLSRSDFLLRGVVMTKTLDPTLPAVYGDSIQLQQLVLNLVLNACEAMRTLERKDQKLHVTTIGRSNGRSRLIISDSGPGFDLSEREKVLQPFYTTKEKGLGLGLTISRSIVQAHGGRLWLGNEEKGGARVTIDFPAVDSIMPPSP